MRLFVGDNVRLHVIRQSIYDHPGQLPAERESIKRMTVSRLITTGDARTVYALTPAGRGRRLYLERMRNGEWVLSSYSKPPVKYLVTEVEVTNRGS